MSVLKIVFGFLWEVLRTLLYGWIVALWQVLQIVWARCRRNCARKRLPGRQGKASPKHCVPISDPAVKRWVKSK